MYAATCSMLTMPAAEQHGVSLSTHACVGALAFVAHTVL